MERFIDSDYRILLSDPVIIDIFRCMDEVYRNEGNIKTEEIIEKLDDKSAEERFREVMLSPPICPEGAVEQAIDEFKDKISKVKVSKSLRTTIGDLEGSTQLLNIVKKRES